jgi:hypothetical protein
VVQEINSARKITIHCNSRKISWTKLKDIQNMLGLDHDTTIQQLSINQQLDNLDPEVFLGGPRSLELPQCNSSFGLPPLYNLLCQFWLQETSDPRDKIYALVGLSTTRNDSHFVIDYSASVRQVFTDAAKYILKSSQRLDVICSTTRTVDEFGLPSWVPNWNINDEDYGSPFISIRLLQNPRVTPVGRTHGSPWAGSKF